MGNLKETRLSSQLCQKLAIAKILNAIFLKVLELRKSGNEFPVSLDEVWPLCYENRWKAVEWLKANFMQDIDYQILTQKGRKPQVGRPSKDYMLTVSCLEFFIARKVRAVFEVYRQVFHGVATGNLPNFSDPVAAARAWADEKEKALRLEADNRMLAYQSEQQKQQLIEQEPKVAFADSIIASKGSCTVSSLAKLVCQAVERVGRPIKIGGKILYKWFRNKGFVGVANSNRNIANQQYVNQGLFELKKGRYDRNGVPVSTLTTYVTPKGQEYFINGFLSGRFQIDVSYETL